MLKPCRRMWGWRPLEASSQGSRSVISFSGRGAAVMRQASMSRFNKKATMACS
ncbi:hypothetical protein [Streptomyces sp. enrichment culture]|uniref:hypothetical protein n=1 Tax=Streptomyces sp. enrichment culture TaxID=1795815 RepID=UPI003F57EDFA